MDTRWISYETVDDGRIAVISLNRPKQRNAQNRGLLVELDEAFRAAEKDDTVRVVVLRGEGPSFSSGHDLGSREGVAEREPGPGQHPSYQSDGGSYAAIERTWRQEWHYYLSNTRRWRDLRKITIASVNGPVIAGGLMLMWCCDLIVASEDAFFCDPVGSRLGMCGVEYFAHPWEFGARKTKELLLTGDGIDAEEAYRLGMVSKIFPNDDLEEKTLEFARRIAKRPTMTSMMIKESVNQTTDIQGFHNATQAALSLHEMNHGHWQVVTNGESIVPSGVPGADDFLESGVMLPARKNEVWPTAGGAK
ncbi:enoyl-CoA hydratase [Cumulibacter manganitolerans]|uniref:enoyl-CoA hydratase n=1 Tax=Cumulibacter manganitolerans TaxID=1884992 RepID=UPI0012977E5D|nr:enoyl-CoA hydratase [Cumulibacter manganitolerans]